MSAINSRRKRSYIVAVCLFLILISISLFCTLMYSSATTIDDPDDVIEEGDTIEVDLTQMEELNQQLESSDVSSFFAFSEEYFLKINEIAKYVSNSIMYIAAALFSVFTFITLLKEAKNGEFTMDYFLKFFLKFAVGAFVLMNTETIFEGLLQFGQALTQLLVDTVKIYYNNSLNFSSTFQLEAGEAIIIGKSNAIANFTVGILSSTLKAAINILNYVLLFEYVLRRAFAPIAVSLVIMEGARGAGYNYIKKTLAVFIKMAIVLLVYKIAVIAAYAIPLNPLTYLFFLGACTVFIHRDMKLADEVMGLS